MNTDDIRQFIAENREIAETQARRWEGVDPSRLLTALGYLEELLDAQKPVVPTGMDATTLSTLTKDAKRVTEQVNRAMDQYPMYSKMERFMNVSADTASLLTDVAELRELLVQPIEMHVDLMSIEQDVVTFERAQAGLRSIRIELVGDLPCEQVEHLWTTARKSKVRIIP